ncbi:MAG: DALR anticodon-binding domain-containing protein, partial [Scytonema sp. PMC 1069.18]|nr:DALR anticodon-binding domain-containing protein [Scytonema sp. PMC 1069.18]
TIKRKIPLSQGRKEKKIFYVSGIAFKLSKYENLPAIDIANRLVSHLLRNGDNELIIQVVSPGWIHLEVAPPTLAAWLEGLIVDNGEIPAQCCLDKQKLETRFLETGFLTPQRLDVTQDAIAVPFGDEGQEGRGDEEVKKANFSALAPPATLFPVQYAYARCCSLVRLAVQEGLIKQHREVEFGTIKSGFDQDAPRVLISTVIPWLDSNAKMRFLHPTSYLLINQLVEVVDQLGCSNSGGCVNWKKAALNLSHVFETFWCQCRIFGEVTTASLELAQVRLGLVMATQSVLKFLLEKKLNTFAIPEI